MTSNSEDIALAHIRLSVLAVAFSAMAAAAAGIGPGPELPGFDRDGPEATVSVYAPGDDCGFFRDQAADQALTHYSQDMLWACEAIARRRAAGMLLGDRLLATQAMLATYRDAVRAAGADAFVRKGREGLPPWMLSLSADEKYRIADATGALLVIEAIRDGF